MPQDLYRIRDFVPDFDAISAEFAARSASLTARAKVLEHVPYGSSQREVVDVIMPHHSLRHAPIHIFVHGGYWRSGEKHNYRLVAEPVLAAGGIAVLVEYDLMPSSRLAVLVDQVRRAVTFVQTHAPDFGADPMRLTVSGHSAGAHLASYLAAAGPDEGQSPALPTVQALLLVSGIYDCSEIPNSFLREEAQMTAAEASSWSPVSSSQHPCPQRIVAYGGAETAPFVEQAARFMTALEAAGEPAEVVAAHDLDHMSVVLDLANPEGLLGRRLHGLVAAGVSGE